MRKVFQMRTKVADLVRSFRSNEGGNFLMTAALSMPVLMLSVAATVQYSMSSNAASKVQQTTDSALMAGAIEANKFEDLTDIVLVEQELKNNAEKFLKAGLEDVNNLEYKINDVDFDPETKVATLKVDYKYPLFMQKITGDKHEFHTTEAQVVLSTQERKPISMYLVLDKSGSMGWYGRMAALKVAVASLTTTLADEDPDQEYVRMGAIAYDSRNARSKVNLNWDPSKVAAYTNALVAQGGTNSSNAMKVAYNAMKNNKEEKQHAKKNKGNPSKYILFLTDGVNNRSSYDTATKKHCNNAKNKAGVQIYAVAFQAPSRAQKLLKDCASSGAHYFEADNAADLIKTFQYIGNETGQSLAFTK